MRMPALIVAALCISCVVKAQPASQQQPFAPLDQKQWEAMKRELAELPISAKGYGMVIHLMINSSAKPRRRRCKAELAKAPRSGEVERLRPSPNRSPGCAEFSSMKLP